MPVSLAYLEQCAADTGYQIAALEKVTRLGEIAGEISRHPSLGDVLALKGGTALNLCFGEVPNRLFVDLDYNYVGSSERRQMLAARPGIETDAAPPTHSPGESGSCDTSPSSAPRIEWIST